MPHLKRLYLILALVFSHLIILGQEVKDERSQQLQEIDSLMLLVFEAYKNVDYNKSFHLAQKTLELSENANYDRGLVQSYLYLAQNYSSVGKYNESQKALNEAYKVNKRFKNKFIEFEINRIKGRNFGDMRLHEKSIDEFRKNLQLIDEIDKNPEEKDYLRSMTYENLYVSYDLIDKLDSSYYYMDLSKRTLNKISPQLAYISKSTLNTYLGRFFMKREMDDSAIYYFNNAALINQKYNYPYHSFNDESWGDLLWKQKKIKPALEKFLEAAKGNENFKSFSFLPDLYNKISDAYLELGQIEDSKIYKNKAFELSQKINEEKLKAIGSELDVVEDEKDKKGNTLKIVQFALLAVLICFLSYLGFNLYKKKKSQSENTASIDEEFDHKVDIEIDEKDESNFEEVIKLAKENSPEFLAKFQDVYPNFTQELIKIQPNLQMSELTFCALIYLNFSTKEIAQFTSTSPRTVQTRKYNIRKKFNIPTETDIYVWMRNIKG